MSVLQVNRIILGGYFVLLQKKKKNYYCEISLMYKQCKLQPSYPRIKTFYYINGIQ